jgi:hypothetical protein
LVPPVTENLRAVRCLPLIAPVALRGFKDLAAWMQARM